jgi:hypothetical protein
MSPQLQLLPPVPPPIGLYVRAGWNDHIVLQQLLVEGRAPTGLVFDARFGQRHRDLWEAAIDAHLDAVLDPGAQELWSPAGRFLGGLAEVPWAAVADEGEPGLRGEVGRQLAALIGQYVADRGFGSVLSPTHYVNGPTDPNVAVDVHLARQLRDNLNARGLSEVRIYYPVAMPASVLATSSARASLRHQLRGLDIDGVWLRLHPFGTSTARPHALRRYIEICVDLQALDIPIVAERTGTVGLALLSYNVVGGIECGVTLGERFDAARLLHANRLAGAPYSNPGMVYLPALDAFVTRRESRNLLARRATKAAVGCRDATCCRRGPDDMTRDHRRHGVIQRVREVVEIGSTPPHRRPERYLDHVTNAGNLAVRLASAHPILEPTRRRLDSWRGTLSGLPDDQVRRDAPPPAIGRRLHGHVELPRLRPIAAPSLA